MPKPRHHIGFREFLANRPMLLDAPMGTRLIALGLDLSRSDPCLWNLEAPEIVRSIHEQDRHAGSHALFTNSFGAHQAIGTGRVADAVNAASVQLARGVIGERGFVVASLGPRSVWNVADFRQVDIMLENGVDALALETSRPDDALTGLQALRGKTSIPILVSVFNRPVPEFWRQAQDRGADAVGVNCLSDFGQIRQILEDASTAVELPLLVKPSAGLPGEALTTPKEFSHEVNAWIERGVRLIGGCCGTTANHIKALRDMLDSNSHVFRPDKAREIGL